MDLDLNLVVNDTLPIAALSDGDAVVYNAGSGRSRSVLNSVSPQFGKVSTTAAASSMAMDNERGFGTMATSDVKSTAVVKYSSMKTPVQFSTIRLNTDLNFPPSDRQRAGCYMFGEQSMPGASSFSPFSSLNMANSYQDLVGEVDVISSSKNIKALLKMPYSQAPQISIMVHRLRKTLLLEEFDVHKNLLRKEAEQWSWLKSFFNTTVAKEEVEKRRCLVSATKRDSFTENIYLNLIRHSFAASIGENQSTALNTTDGHAKQVNSVPEFSEDLKGFHHETLWTFEDISMLIDSDLPIFGSGSSPRPCISLRLKDARSPPISVLTGLDYWLDNLMSNVPEVAMCFHVDGFVQKYEVIRTEDIPHLNGSSFDPEEVMDIARNIMAFIKANAAVEGHTYWLYKGDDDEMVKLYDLTDYCKSQIVEGDNPFTVPVGLLCHRVGTKLKMSGQRRSADSRAMLENCLRLLDDTKHSEVCAEAHFHLCDMWVPDRSVNDIWHEKGKIPDMPSDLYDEESTSDDGLGPDKGTNLGDEGNSGSSMQAIEHKPAENTSQEGVQNAVALKELVVRGMTKKKAWDIVQACRIAGETDERCKMALGHIRKGLNCVDKDQARGKNIGLVEKQQTCSPSKAIPLHYAPLNINTKDEQEDQQENLHLHPTHSTVKEEYQGMCNPSQAIPLHFTPLKTATDSQEKQNPSSLKTNDVCAGDKNVAAESKSESCSWESSSSSSRFDASHQSGSSSSESWHVEAKFNLLRKGAITYFVLAKSFFEINKYGHTLRHLRYAMHCYEAQEVLVPSVCGNSQHQELYLMLLFLAAKARSSLTSTWATCAREFEELGEEEAAILSSAQATLPAPKNSWVYDWPTNQESNWSTAEELFQQIAKFSALETKNAQFKFDLKKNHAACLVGLANTQLEILKERTLKNCESFDSVKSIWEKALNNFKMAVQMFESVGEKNTAAHVICNVAYLYNLAAGTVKRSNLKEPIPAVKRKYLDKCIEFNEKALNLLERGESMDDTREKICHTLRLVYHDMACCFSKGTHPVTDQHLKSMKDFLFKSLFYCHPENSGKFQRNNQIMAARNHLNLARVYEVEMAKFKSATRKRALLQKCEESYQVCFDLYECLGWSNSQIAVKDLWTKSIRDNWSHKTSGGSQKKLYRSLLLHLCDLQSAVERLALGEEDSEDLISIFDSSTSPIGQLLSRLNTYLPAYFKVDKTNTSIKSLYQRSLRLVPQKTASDLPSQLSVVLQDLREALASEPPP
ncbi:uncharacterized protein LOC101857061 [Aplysia californica]|uniref:Uncharacterized protein LOC101857061 n=1 Tax=Aplysia californica TaxID=6500 RepID=A0ABM0K5K8_APLCA|nr:uncharacterized protein LOC101857061 [Aplysia californica]